MTAPSTFALIPGAGGNADYWRWVLPHLTSDGHAAVAVDLPAADASAGLDEYRDTVLEAVAGVDGPLILVAQSMGGLTAPLVADRRPVDLIVLVNAMVPVPGESGGAWWTNTGQREASLSYMRQIGLQREGFDFVEDFFHDVPDDIRREVLAADEPEQSDAPFAEPWPLTGWPDVPTRFLQGTDDRMFPLEFQRRLVRERLGLDVDTIAAGHLPAFSRPELLADRLHAYRCECGLP